MTVFTAHVQRLFVCESHTKECYKYSLSDISSIQLNQYDYTNIMGKKITLYDITRIS